MEWPVVEAKSGTNPAVFGACEIGISGSKMTGEITMHSSGRTQAPGHIFAGVLWACPGSAAPPAGGRGAAFFTLFRLGKPNFFQKKPHRGKFRDSGLCGTGLGSRIG